jgi:hypothetical protein
MQSREYFRWAHRYLRSRRQLPSVTIHCHDVDTGLLEGVLSRGDRRVGEGLELAWRRGARLDSWREHFQPELWWQAFDDCGVNVQQALHESYAIEARLPWDHLNVKKGRTYLEKEQQRSTVQLEAMAGAI